MGRRPMRVVTARRLKPTSSKLGSQAFYAETCIMRRQCFGWNSYNDISCFGLFMDISTMEKDTFGKLLPTDLASKRLQMQDINDSGKVEGVYVRGT